MSWNYGTLYQKETKRTTLALEEPVDCEQAGEMTVRVLGGVRDLEDREADTKCVYPLTYAPYYTVCLRTESGITVKASRTVRKSSVNLAAAIIDRMLTKLPEVAGELRRRGAAVAVYGFLEDAYDVPEHRMGYLTANRHIEGFGGEAENPMSSIAEANVMRLRSGRYATAYPHEMILVHEFGHAIHLVGMDNLTDKTLSVRVKSCYQHAKDAGLWADTYAIGNHEEYFATLGTIWFNVMQEGIDGKHDGIRGPVNTREELREYDPEGYAFMRDIYPETPLPAPWDHNVNHYGIDGTPLCDMGPCYDLGPEKFNSGLIHG